MENPKGKVTIIIESSTATTDELYDYAKKAFDFLMDDINPPFEMPGETYLKDGSEFEFSTCVYIVPGDD